VILDVISDDKLPNTLPQFRTLVGIYATASRLKVHNAMDVILDAFL
jgi:hypothetical protein